MTRFCVITGIPADDDPDGGNLCHELDLWVDRSSSGLGGREVEKISDERMFEMNVMTRVFELGEIIVLNEGGREAGGVGRKPSKWLVDYEEFEDVEDALVCSRRVLEGKLAGS